MCESINIPLNKNLFFVFSKIKFLFLLYMKNGKTQKTLAQQPNFFLSLE